jgi:hypothetical protein
MGFQSLNRWPFVPPPVEPQLAGVVRRGDDCGIRQVERGQP